MNETLHHRGPDSSGAFVEGNVGLAARRLSIIDLAGGDQPVANEDGRIQVVQNGEIYNHAELRARLERAGPPVRDPQRHRGARAPLRGARPGVRRGPARHVRDRALGPPRAAAGAGARPLRDQAALLPRRGRRAVVRLGAEGAAAPAGVLARRRPRRARGLPRVQLDPGAADDLRRGAQAAARPHAAVAGGRAGAAPLRAAAPRRRPAASATEDERSLAEELRERLRDSVRAHLVSDVPVGVLLSGGIDSSALAALAARESSYRVSTFSIGFEERAFNELEQARLVAEHYGTDHHELVVRPGRRRAAAPAGGGVRRAVRGLVGAAHLPRLAARRRHREGGALRRRRRRAVRRLLHLRGGQPRAPRRPRRLGAAAARRGAAELLRQGQLRLQGEAVRARGAPAAARAPPRLEGDLLGRRARGAARRPPRRRSTRSTSTAPATPRRRGRTSWRGCRTSTSASTSPTTCS